MAHASIVTRESRRLTNPFSSIDVLTPSRRNLLTAHATPHGYVEIGGRQLAPDHVPTVLRFGSGASAPPEPSAEACVVEHPQDRLRKCRGFVGDQYVVAVLGSESLASDGRAHHCVTHRPRVEDLDSRAAPSPQRHDVADAVAHERTDVGHVPG